MSIVLYSKYRRMKLRAAWELAGMVVWCKEIGIWIAAILLAFVFVAWADAQAEAADKADMERTKAERNSEKNEAAWLSCLNNKGVWVNGELHTCRLENTRLSRSDFK